MAIKPSYTTSWDTIKSRPTLDPCISALPSFRQSFIRIDYRLRCDNSCFRLAESGIINLIQRDVDVDLGTMFEGIKTEQSYRGANMLSGRAVHLGVGPTRTMGAGAVSGFVGGACGIFGPAAMIYLLGRNMDARTTRADAIVFLTGESLILRISYIGYGMVTLPRLHLSLLLIPIYTICISFGAKGFSHISAASYRRIVLWLLLVDSGLITAKAGVSVL